jgi:23S rRNA (cytosine1962-C5)-methyltransferase
MFEVKGWVRLHRGEDARIRDGHLWVYRNEIAEQGGGFSNGDVVWVEDSRHRKLGTGYINLNSLISVRLLSRGSNEVFDRDLFHQRLVEAAERRSHITCQARRIINAEGDHLPGLIVDLYDRTCVLQLQTLAWESRKDMVISEIDRVLEPGAIVLRNDSSSRQAEGLERYRAVVKGQIEANHMIEEAGLEIEVDLLGGQKTGFYIDQRENRKMVLPFVRGRRVLDCFCYSGAWSLMCARAGASEVTGLDSSGPAVDLALRNADRNDLGGNTDFIVRDVFTHLPDLAAAKEKYDVIILDPPSLAKTRRVAAGARRGYIHINRLAMGLLSPGGMLVSCSCSHHVRGDIFAGILREAARLARKRASVVRTGGQPDDHPSLLGLPESDYLKCFLLRVV